MPSSFVSKPPGCERSRPNPQRTAAFRDAAQKLQKEQTPFDEPTQQQLAKTAQDAEKMRMANELISQGERLRAAVLQQRELADRMAQFRDRKKLAEDDLQRIATAGERAGIAAAGSRRSEIRAGEDRPRRPKRHFPKCRAGALKVVKAIDEMQVGNDQAQAARSARGGQGEEAFGAAESAAKKLESLLSECLHAQGGGRVGRLGRVLPALQARLAAIAATNGAGPSDPGVGTAGKPRAAALPARRRGCPSSVRTSSPKETATPSARADRPAQGPGIGGTGPERDASRGAETLNPATRPSLALGGRQPARRPLGLPRPGGSLLQTDREGAMK